MTPGASLLLPVNAYDEVPYPSYTHSQTHPNRLATVARLLGLRPASIERCRVLELGCGDASNLTPMAAQLPGSEFVGVDLAQRPIAAGTEKIAALGYKNIRLHHADLAQVGADWGRFDYIIAHGVYSWVPPAVRDRLLEVCRSNLAEEGIAFVSYNAYPGGHVRTMLREMLLYHVHGFASPGEKIAQAKALVAFLSSAHSRDDDYAQLLRHEAERIRDHGNEHLFHDDLADQNQPFYFGQFVHHAARHGLQYVGEADFFEMSDHGLPADVRESLNALSGDRIRREQYLDFLKCRRFRQTLLCHGERELHFPPRPETVAGLLASTVVPVPSPAPSLRPGEVARFQTAKGARADTDFPLGKAALMCLAEVAPEILPVTKLAALSCARLAAEGIDVPAGAEAERQLSEFLLGVYACGVVDLHAFRPAFCATVSARPRASDLARWQARRRETLTSAFHTAVNIEDEVARHLIDLLDGTRSHADLASAMHEFLETRAALNPPQGGPKELRRRIEEDVERNLRKLANIGLLVA